MEVGAGAQTEEMEEAEEGDKVVGPTVTGHTACGQAMVGLTAKTNPETPNNRAVKEGRLPHLATGNPSSHADHIRPGPKTPKATPMQKALFAKNAATEGGATVAVAALEAKPVAKIQAVAHPLLHQVNSGGHFYAVR
jgi:hypothetical protein